MGVWVVNATIGEDHKLTIEVPPDVPIGAVRVTVEQVRPEPMSGEIGEDGRELTLRELKEKLIALGVMERPTRLTPDGYVPPTPEERARLAKLASGGPTLMESIDEDRGPRP